MIKNMIRDKSAHPVMENRTGNFFIETKNSDKKTMDIITCLITSPLISIKPWETEDMDKAKSRVLKRFKKYALLNIAINRTQQTTKGTTTYNKSLKEKG